MGASKNSPGEGGQNGGYGKERTMSARRNFVRGQRGRNKEGSRIVRLKNVGVEKKGNMSRNLPMECKEERRGDRENRGAG